MILKNDTFHQYMYLHKGFFFPPLFISGIFKVDLKIVWQEYKRIGRIVDFKKKKKKAPSFEG